MSCSRAARGLALLAAAPLYACAEPGLPDPRMAADEFARAVERGDADAVYALMTEESQQTYGREGTARLVAESRRELSELGRALKSKQVSVETQAEVRYYDGERSNVAFENGQFRVTAAAGFPARARTPEQALQELREALARRSYAGLTRVLSSETRSALERDLRSLVEGLEHPETLEIEVLGDTARVQVPGGHSVQLKREAGVWRVEDFH